MRKKDLQSKNASGQAEIFVCALYTGREIVYIWGNLEYMLHSL